MNASAQRGMELFFSERPECFHCHAGFNFSDSVNHEGKALAEFAFHNNGLYSLDEKVHIQRETKMFELTMKTEIEEGFVPRLCEILLLLHHICMMVLLQHSEKF